MKKARVVVPVGTRNPEATVVVASGAGRHARPKPKRRVIMRLRRTAFLSAAVASALGIASIAAGSPSGKFTDSETSGTSSFSEATLTGSSSLVQSCPATGIKPGEGTTTAQLSAASTSIVTGANTVAVTPLAKAISTGNVLLIGQATGSLTGTATANAAIGATSISFTTTASGTFAQGALVTNLSSQNTASPTPCKFHYAVGGTASQYVAVDVLVVSGDGSHPKLWDPSAAGLELVMTDGSNNAFTLPTSTATCPNTGDLASSVPVGTLVCGLTSNDVLSTTPLSAGATVDLTLNWGLPLPAPSADQGGNTSIFVQFHAVQAGNNALNCSSMPTSAGQPCAPAGSFSWS
jgi:hypothetical protein